MPGRGGEVGKGLRGGEADSGSATIATVERAADVLLHFVATPRPNLGITEIADELGLSKAAVHRILASLRSRGLIDLDEQTRRYSLGVAAMRLGMAYLDRIDVRRIAHPFLVELSERTNETATLSIRIGFHRIYVEQITPDREVIMSVTLGTPYPLHAGASSRAFMAYLSEEELNNYLASVPLESLTPGTITDPETLRADLAEVRAQGYAHSIAERMSGAASVAAPVLGHDKLPVAVISVCGPAERFMAEFDHCRDTLLDVSRRLSEKCGWTLAAR